MRGKQIYTNVNKYLRKLETSARTNGIRKCADLVTHTPIYIGLKVTYDCFTLGCVIYLPGWWIQPLSISIMHISLLNSHMIIPKGIIKKTKTFQ